MRRRGLNEHMLWLTKLYAGHRLIVALHVVLARTNRAVGVIDMMPCETLEDRFNRANRFMEEMRA